MPQWLEVCLADVKFAARQLKAAPTFTLVAALTLALGIGANSAIFALVDATLLRPLSFDEPDRLVAIWETSERSDRSEVSPINMLDWGERTRSFEIIAGFAPGSGSMVMSRAEGITENVSRQWVTAGLFDVMGVAPILGRTFHAADGASRDNLVVLSEGLWRSRFDGRREIVGQQIRFDGDLFTVLGVMPEGFQLRRPASMWAMRWFPRVPQLRGAYGLRAVGRLKSGVTIEAAQADISGVADQLAREFPATNRGRGAVIEPLQEALVGRDLRLTSMLFLGVVGLVLLICCVNVANLLMVRATTRQKELAVRSAVGAGRTRLVRQLVTESLLLAAIGGALAIAVGAGLLSVAPALVPENLLPAAVTLVFGVRVVAFCLVTAVLVGLVFGLAPAWHATGTSSSSALAAAGRAVTGRGSRARGMLVVSEVAMAVLLLFGAGLLLRTLATVDGVNRGYRARAVLSMLVDPIGSAYPTPADLTRFFDDVEREIMRDPRFRSVGWTSTLPLGASQLGPVSVEIVGDPIPAASQRPLADFQIASPSYFQTIDLPLTAGRPFTSRDTADTPPVCIVSQEFVRRHLQGRSPVGVRLALRPSDAPNTQPVVREIVGVAQQVKARPDDTENRAQIYVPLAQFPIDDIFLVAASQEGRRDGLAASVRAAIGRIDTRQLVGVLDVRTLEDVAWMATGRYRFRAALVTTFAALALVLAMVGVFGVLGYSVQQRWREFGIRRALGATTRDVLTLVVGGGGRLVLLGTAIGLAAAAASGRTITAFLFGVEPLDPMTFAIVALILVLAGLAATAAPALRAARVDPAVAFRNDD